MPRHFHDRHDCLRFLKARETARRIREDPALIASARTFVAGFMVPDPHQRRYAALWLDLLARGADEIAAALTEDSEQGRLLRETSPVFGPGLTSREIVALQERADAPQG